MTNENSVTSSTSDYCHNYYHDQNPLQARVYLVITHANDLLRILLSVSVEGNFAKTWPFKQKTIETLKYLL